MISPSDVNFDSVYLTLLKRESLMQNWENWNWENDLFYISHIMATSRIFWSKINIFSSCILKDSPFSCDHFDGKVVVKGWPEAEKSWKKTPKISINYNSIVTSSMTSSLWVIRYVFSTFLSFRSIFDHNLTIKMIARKRRIFWYISRKKCGFSTKNSRSRQSEIQLQKGRYGLGEVIFDPVCI